MRHSSMSTEKKKAVGHNSERQNRELATASTFVQADKVIVRDLGVYGRFIDIHKIKPFYLFYRGFSIM